MALHNWWSIWFTPFAASGLTFAERTMITEQIRHFPPSHTVMNQPGQININYAIDASGGARAASLAGGTLVFYSGQFRNVSIGVTWHELMGHLGQLVAHVDGGGDKNDHSREWPPFLFTPPEMVAEITTGRPEVEWEPTLIGQLLNPDRAFETARDHPLWTELAIAYMLSENIRVPQYVTAAAASAPAPTPGPGPALPDEPQPTDPVPVGDGVSLEAFTTLSLEIDTRFEVQRRDIAHIQEHLGIASKSPPIT